MAIIKTANLTKKFKELVAVDNISLEIEEGECFGLLGPNGAGKTTLIRMITAVSPPTQGDIWVAGLELKKHPRDVKAILGVVPQVDNLDDDLNVVQNLRTFARYFAIPKDEAKRRSLEILKTMHLEEKKNSKIEELSGGMKRRLLIGRGLINNPKIMILDEPSIGLDPQARHMVWQKLRELKTQGITQLLCTQNMEEAARLCSQVAIIHQGRIIDIDTPQALVSRYVGSRVWEIDLASVERDSVIRELEGHQLEFEEFAGIIHVFTDDDRQVAGLPGAARAATLEDVFFRLWRSEGAGAIIEPILVLLAFGMGMGAFVGVINGQRYIEFIAPGIIAGYAMFSASFECTYGSYFRMEHHYTFDAILATPLNVEDITAGEIFWGATRACITGSIVLAIAAAFQLVPSFWALLIPLVAALSGVMFASVALFVTSIVPSIYTFNFFFTLFITPMFLLAGVFFPLNRFPEIVQTLSWIAPLTPVAYLSRGLFRGDLQPQMWLALGIIVAWAIVFFAITLLTMRWRLTK